MLDIIQSNTAASYIANQYGPPIPLGDYDANLKLGLARKNMRLALELAEVVGAGLLLCELTTDICRQVCETYGDDANHLMAIWILEEANGLYLRSPS